MLVRLVHARALRLSHAWSDRGASTAVHGHRGRPWQLFAASGDAVAETASEPAASLLSHTPTRTPAAMGRGGAAAADAAAVAAPAGFYAAGSGSGGRAGS